MKWYYKLRMVYKILIPVSGSLLVALSLMAWQIQSKGSEIIQNIAERELVALGGSYSGEVHRFISSALNSAIEMSNAIGFLEEYPTSTPLARTQSIAMLASALRAEQIIASGILLLPRLDDAQYVNTEGSDAKGQFYPYVTNSGVNLMDYQEFSSNYFAIAQNTKKPHISDPYYYTVDGVNTLIMTASAPIVVNNVFKGVVVLDFKLDDIFKMAHDIKVYDTGSISILAQNGLVIAHANPKLLQKNMFELDRWKNNHGVRDAVAKGESYTAFALSGGVQNIYYFHPILFPKTGQVLYFVMIAPLQEVLADVAQLTNITLIASLFTLVVLCFVIFFGVRSSMKPLTVIATAAAEVAKGNFEVNIDERTFGGEILHLKRALDTMIGSLVENINKANALSEDAQAQTLKAQEAMSEAEAARVAAEGAKREGMLAAAHHLEDVVSIVSSASQKLSSKIEQSEFSSTRQAGRVAETATAMEEMNSTVLEVAQSASTANEMSSKARTQAEVGTQIVQDAVSGITGVQEVSLALKEDMNTLSAKAMAISEIMNVISDIADQTNLLALNAAIEAARAGEAGRGFAVVADEVRKLAEKTMHSTTDVGNAIRSIQDSVNISIKQVDKAVELISIATEQSIKSGGSLSEIMSLVDTTADQVRAIATASEEQSATSEEINRAISEINELAEQGAKGMREAREDVNELTTQAQALSKLIDEMKKG